jgi:hypothetical protein
MPAQRIVFPPHFLDGCIHFVHGVAECREGTLRAIGAPKVKHRPLDRPNTPPVSADSQIVCRKIWTSV